MKQFFIWAVIIAICFFWILVLCFAKGMLNYYMGWHHNGGAFVMIIFSGIGIWTTYRLAIFLKKKFLQ